MVFSNEDLSKCNFKEDDGSDPLGVDDFIHNKAGQRDGFRYAHEYFLYIHGDLDRSPCRHEVLF